MDYKANAFMQAALNKLDRKEHLTYYEKAAVGGYYVERLTQLEIETLTAMAAEQYPDMLRELTAKRKGGLTAYTNDQRMDEPMVITEDMIFRVLVFESKTK